MSTDDELLDALGAALAPELREPPAERIDALRAAAEARAADQDQSRAAADAGPRRWFPALAAAAAAIIAFTAGAVTFSGRTEKSDVLAGGSVEFDISLTSPDGSVTADATGIKTGIGRTVQLRTDELPILPKGELYELWFVGPGDSPVQPNRISAGTFHPDDRGRSRVDLTAAVDPALYPELLVTAEPGDGNPAPTGPVVLRGKVTVKKA